MVLTPVSQFLVTQSGIWTPIRAIVPFPLNIILAGAGHAYGLGGG